MAKMSTGQAKEPKTPSHDSEAVYRRAQDQVNHVKSMYIFCIQTQDQVVFLMIEAAAVRSTVRIRSSCSNNSSMVRFS